MITAFTLHKRSLFASQSAQQALLRFASETLRSFYVAACCTCSPTNWINAEFLETLLLRGYFSSPLQQPCVSSRRRLLQGRGQLSGVVDQNILHPTEDSAPPRSRQFEPSHPQSMEQFITMIENLKYHPADQLADCRRIMRLYRYRADVLREWLLDHPDDRVGDKYEAYVETKQSQRLDRALLARQLGCLRPYQTTSETDYVNMRRLRR